MKNIKITVSTTTEGSEIIADILSGYSFGGVIIEDKNDILSLQRQRRETWDYIDDALLANMGGDVLVSCFTDKGKAKELTAELKDIFSRIKSEGGIDFGTLNIKMCADDPKAWHKIWKQNFHPIRIGNVVICPKWKKYRRMADEKIVLLDSGMAFGTGEHETTAMCIELMQSFDFEGKTVFDIGCGSGILGLTAVKLGAEKVYLSDIDAMAIAASTQNAKLNKASVKIEQKSLLDGAEGKADFILANLTAGLLNELCAAIKTAAQSYCKIILSGIIDTKLAEVIDCYTAEGFRLLEQKAKNDWRALAFIYGEQ